MSPLVLLGMVLLGVSSQSCPGFDVQTSTVGVTSNPFDQTTTANAGACCTFCKSFVHCVAWTFHPPGQTCYVANISTPHNLNDTVTTGVLTPKPPLGFQPNIIFLLTDDQDRMLGGHDDSYTPLGSLEDMAKTRQFLIEEGASFSNFFVNTPICCPSRTEFFTGRYFHNVRAPSGAPECMHVTAEANVFNKTASMFSLLQSAGYATGVFGKVTNDQGSAYWAIDDKKTWKAQGMTEINSPIEYNDYDSPHYFRKLANGSMSVEALGPSPPFGTTYQTTQIGNRSLEWLDEVGKTGQPFFLYLGPHAPHFPAKPAPWYTHWGDKTVRAPFTINYNLSCPDKTIHIRQNPPLTEDVKCWEDQHMRDRWSALQSVDDLVNDLIEKLTSLNLLNKTFIFYASDHGYKLGQWRVGVSKQHPFETDIRIPFLVRGPGVSHGQSLTQLGGNVDLLPTLLNLAGVEAPPFVDGKSLLPFLLPSLFPKPAEWRDHFLIEYQAVGTYWNDHASIWHDDHSGPQGKWECSQNVPRGPSGMPDKCTESQGIGNGNCYYVDSEYSNTWRGLRVMNSSQNLMYAEYEWNGNWGWKKTDFAELYDLDKDPYQMTNLAPTTPPSVLQQLHSTLETYGDCKGSSSEPSNCP